MYNFLRAVDSCPFDSNYAKNSIQFKFKKKIRSNVKLKFEKKNSKRK